MEQKEIEKQRLIGKQLMIVDLIHEENDRASRTGFSFVSRDKLGKWARMEKDEIAKIIDTCSYMDDFTMQCDAARDLAYNLDGSVGSNAYLFYLSTYRRFWYLTLTCLDKGSIDDYCSKNAKKNYDEYMKKHQEYPVDEGVANADLFKTVLEHYVRWFVNCFKNALEDGYDWDVVTRMARMEISQERFQILEQI